MLWWNPCLSICYLTMSSHNSEQGKIGIYFGTIFKPGIWDAPCVTNVSFQRLWYFGKRPFPKNSHFYHQYLILIQESILSMVELCNDYLPQYVMSVWCELLASCFRSALTISCRSACVRNHCKWSFHPFKSIQELCWTHTHKPHCLQTALRPGWWRPEIKGGLEGHGSLLNHCY